MIYSSGGTFSDLAEIVRNACEDIRPHRREFDSIVVRGASGIIVGSPLALRLRKPLVVVRKPHEMDVQVSHAHRAVEGDRDLGRRYLWVDDFVSSGATREAVHQTIVRYADTSAVMALQYLYEPRSLTETERCVLTSCEGPLRSMWHERPGCTHNGPCRCDYDDKCAEGHWQKDFS